MCQRFLRSVLRVYTVCQLEATNIPSPPLSSCTPSKKKRYQCSLVPRPAPSFPSLTVQLSGNRIASDGKLGESLRTRLIISVYM